VGAFVTVFLLSKFLRKMNFVKGAGGGFYSGYNTDHNFSPLLTSPAPFPNRGKFPTLTFLFNNREYQFRTHGFVRTPVLKAFEL
jgi:hypothetical protein